MSRLLFGPISLGAKIATFTGVSVVGYGLASRMRSPILNDSFGHQQPAVAATYPAYSADKRHLYYDQRSRSRLGGKLDYEQLSVGSFTGLLTGYVVGKISKLLVFLTVTGLLTLQYLESRGIIRRRTIPMLSNMARYAEENVDVKEFMLDQPSFKVSFMSSFIIAACYA